VKTYLVTVKVEVDDVRGEDLWDALSVEIPESQEWTTTVTDVKPWPETPKLSALDATHEQYLHDKSFPDGEVQS
jgi:hypothetical protein